MKQERKFPRFFFFLWTKPHSAIAGGEKKEAQREEYARRRKRQPWIEQWRRGITIKSFTAIPFRCNANEKCQEKDWMRRKWCLLKGSGTRQDARNATLIRDPSSDLKIFFQKPKNMNQRNGDDGGRVRGGGARATVELMGAGILPPADAAGGL